MTYMGYKIERAANEYGTMGWGVFVEEHDYGKVTEKMTYWAKTQEEAKLGCRCHFGRL